MGGPETEGKQAVCRPPRIPRAFEAYLGVLVVTDRLAAGQERRGQAAVSTSTSGFRYSEGQLSDIGGLVKD